MLGDPLGRLGAMARFTVIESGESFIGIGATVEDHHWSIWLLGLDEKIKGKERAAMTLEAGSPIFWVKGHTRADTVSEVRLRRGKVCEGPVLFA